MAITSNSELLARNLQDLSLVRDPERFNQRRAAGEVTRGEKTAQRKLSGFARNPLFDTAKRSGVTSNELLAQGVSPFLEGGKQSSGRIGGGFEAGPQLASKQQTGPTSTQSIAQRGRVSAGQAAGIQNLFADEFAQFQKDLFKGSGETVKRRTRAGLNRGEQFSDIELFENPELRAIQQERFGGHLGKNKKVIGQTDPRMSTILGRLRFQGRDKTIAQEQFRKSLGIEESSEIKALKDREKKLLNSVGSFNLAGTRERAEAEIADIQKKIQADELRQLVASGRITQQKANELAGQGEQTGAQQAAEREKERDLAAAQSQVTRGGLVGGIPGGVQRGGGGGGFAGTGPRLRGDAGSLQARDQFVMQRVADQERFNQEELQMRQQADEQRGQLLKRKTLQRAAAKKQLAASGRFTTDASGNLDADSKALLAKIESDADKNFDESATQVERGVESGRQRIEQQRAVAASQAQDEMRKAELVREKQEKALKGKENLKTALESFQAEREKIPPGGEVSYLANTPGVDGNINNIKSVLRADGALTEQQISDQVREYRKALNPSLTDEMLDAEDGLKATINDLSGIVKGEIDDIAQITTILEGVPISQQKNTVIAALENQNLDPDLREYFSDLVPILGIKPEKEKKGAAGPKPLSQNDQALADDFLSRHPDLTLAQIIEGNIDGVDKVPTGKIRDYLVGKVRTRPEPEPEPEPTPPTPTQTPEPEPEQKGLFDRVGDFFGGEDEKAVAQTGGEFNADAFLGL